jgi:hypothetical protein
MCFFFFLKDQKMTQLFANIFFTIITQTDKKWPYHQLALFFFYNHLNNHTVFNVINLALKTLTARPLPICPPKRLPNYFHSCVIPIAKKKVSLSTLVDSH